jgi:hypothetical protein
MLRWNTRQEVPVQTSLATYAMQDGRFEKRLITILNEFDGLVRPWTQSTFELGVTVQCD